MLREQNAVAKVAAFAEMCDFPCSKQELLQMADEQEFPDEVLDVLEDLPNTQFTCESEIVEAARVVDARGDVARTCSTSTRIIHHDEMQIPQ
jgi:hypothetical protein